MIYFPAVAFFILIVVGAWLQELEVRQSVLFVIIWAGGIALFDFFRLSRSLFVPLEVLLDCILVFKICGGDIRIR